MRTKPLQFGEMFRDDAVCLVPVRGSPLLVLWDESYLLAPDICEIAKIAPETITTRIDATLPLTWRFWALPDGQICDIVTIYCYD